MNNNYCNTKLNLIRAQVVGCGKRLADLMKQVKLLTSEQPLMNRGKGVDEVEERQRRRKIALLRESCERALWFTDTFNVDLLKVVLRTKNSCEEISLNYQDSPLGTSSSSSDATQQQLQVRQVLYLLDRFAISDEFYHELSMLTPSLPRSHRIKRARDRINATVELLRLPQPYSGCYRSFKECLKETITAEVRCFKHYYQQPEFTFPCSWRMETTSRHLWRLNLLVMGHRFPEFLRTFCSLFP